MLTMNNAKRYYKGRLAMQCEHFHVAEGDCIGVFGDNGSGKSTLLRVLAGLTRLSHGSLQMEEAWRAARIAYSPQSGGLYGDLSVLENIKVYQRIFGSRSANRLSNDLWESTGLAQYADLKAQALSGGFQKLAAIVAVLSVGADILLLDEPSADLSPVHMNSMIEIVSKVGEHYLAVVLSEHSPQVLSAARRTIELTRP
jgi:ABC-type multidrug transport system ATPase subunit